MDVEKLERRTGEPRLWWLLVFLCFVVLVLAANWWLLQEDQQRGTFGDMFGGVNALFSGAAFSVLAYTLLLQRHELKLQRQELSATRAELEAQRHQMASQAKTLKLQQFENTFFQLIKGYGDIVQNMKIVGYGSYAGRSCFPQFIDYLKSNYSHAEGVGRERVDEAINQLYGDFESELGHYFRHLYHILKFIDEHKEVDRLRYRAFLRAQLSADEFTLLFYNCLGHRGQKCKPLVEKYGMLKHLRPAALLKQEHADYFDKRAFSSVRDLDD